MASGNDDEQFMTENSWNKLKNTAEKAGYRDGISKGRELNFQKSFDDGYNEGFKNGFFLGFYKGGLSITDIKHGTEIELEKVSRGNCNICKHKELENKVIPEIILIQTEDTNKILSKLQEKYSTIINIPNKIT